MIHIWDTLIDIPLVFQISGRYVARIQVIQDAQLQWKRMERRRSFPRLATCFFHIKMADVVGGKKKKEGSENCNANTSLAHVKYVYILQNALQIPSIQCFLR